MNRPVYPPKKSTPPARGNTAEAALQRSQKALRQVLQSVPVAICVIDSRDQIYLDANQTFAELVGLERRDILYHRDRDLKASLGESNLQKIMARLQNGEEVSDLELFIFNQTGKLIKGRVRAEKIEYAGRECALVAFTQTVKDDSPHPRALQHETRLNTAGEIGLSISELMDLDEIYMRLCSAVYQLLPDVCTVLVSLYDKQFQRITCAYGEHENEALDVGQIPPLQLEPPGRGIQSDVIRTRQAIVVDDLQERMRDAQLRPRFTRPGKVVQSGVYVPMVSRGAVVGVLQALSYKPARYNQTDAALVGLIANTAAIAIQNLDLAKNLERTNLDLTQTYDATIEGWMRALELRDGATERHTYRVVGLTVELGKKLGLDGYDLVKVKRGAQLHDIGKMGIPDEILLKPGPLDESEWRVMRKHPVYAYELLRPIPHFSEIIDIPYCHHEKWDGSGYPRRLKGAEIPLPARIFTIVDVWDALNSPRPYRAAWPQHQVLDYIQYQSNKHFEPDVARAFIDLVKGKNNNGHSPAPGGQLLRKGSTIFFMR